MNCWPNYCGLKQVCPVTDRQELLSLSFSDIRRIAAVRAADKLKQRMMLQNKLIPQGKMQLNSSQRDSLLPDITNSYIKIVNNTWDYFIKYIDYHGVGMLSRFIEKNPSLRKYFPKLMTGNKCRDLQYLRCDRKALQYGRSLLAHMSDIIANLRNNEALKNYITQKFSRAREAGVQKETIELLQEELLSYMSESMPSQWSPEVNTAWRELTTAIITIGTQTWDLSPTARKRAKDLRMIHTTSFASPMFETHSLYSKASSST